MEKVSVGFWICPDARSVQKKNSCYSALSKQVGIWLSDCNSSCSEVKLWRVEKGRCIRQRQSKESLVMVTRQAGGAKTRIGAGW